MKQQTEVKETQSKTMPVHSVRSGLVQGSVWRNVRQIEGKEVEFFNCQITKRYKDGEEWKSTNSYAKNDLHHLITVANELFKHLAFNEYTEE